ncbi:MAG: VWA domain-containing protein [Candidatus Omnitrophica bacterium]|nr:VWA domain-containing protein [Candidatus Omnitrophota bacterium]
MRLADPLYLLLLAGLVLIVIFRRQFSQNRAGVTYSQTAPFGRIPPSLRRRLSIVPFVLRVAVVTLMVVGLSRPQYGTTEEELITEGVDIILTLDISGSMKAEDFKPQNRLGAAKEVIKKFIDERQHDRVGMVVFARYAITQCPLTLDYGILKRLTDEVTIGMIADGTAIGTAIATAVNRLKDSTAKSKVIILLTDGVNNQGEIDPITAARVAKTFGIKIYTIGAGTPGGALYPVDHPIFGRQYVRMATEIDEKTLDEIARITGGLYFRAKDEKGLGEIYEHINRLEKTEIQTREYVEYDERANTVLIPALLLLLSEIVLSGTALRVLP